MCLKSARVIPHNNRKPAKAKDVYYIYEENKKRRQETINQIIKEEEEAHDNNQNYSDEDRD